MLKVKFQLQSAAHATNTINWRVEHFSKNTKSHTAKPVPDMTLICFLIWLLCFPVCECWQLNNPEAVMHGVVQSPQYPKPYPPNLLKQWEILLSEGFQIQLFLTHLDIKASEGCNQDSLTVLFEEKVLAKICGQDSLSNHSSKEPILSPGNRLTLIFQTSDSTPELQTHIGFSATYKAIVVSDCGEPEPLLNGGVTYLSGFQNLYRSVIQYHCNQPFYSLHEGANVNFTCEADGKWKSNNKSDVPPTCIPVCGKPTKLISAYQRIIGGNEAPENTIPWQVLVSIDGARGGGMVIADRWIMTAAHIVVEDGNPVPNDTIRVFMGVTDVNIDLNPGVQAASVYVHPEYENPNSVDYNNDIALIKLHDPITFNPSIMPICLPTEDATYHTGTMGLVSGFGIIKIDGKMVLKNKLQYVQLPLVNQETCSNSITLITKTKTNVPPLTNNMFCAGFPEGGKDSCQGDGGGPFAFYDNGQFWAAGIVSWGFECGQRGAYGVYTKVSNYLSWITKTVQEN